MAFRGGDRACPGLRVEGFSRGGGKKGGWGTELLGESFLMLRKRGMLGSQ